MLDLKSFDLLTFLRTFEKFIKCSYLANSEKIKFVSPVNALNSGRAQNSSLTKKLKQTVYQRIYHDCISSMENLTRHFKSIVLSISQTIKKLCLSFSKANFTNQISNF